MGCTDEGSGISGSDADGDANIDSDSDVDIDSDVDGDADGDETFDDATGVAVGPDGSVYVVGTTRETWAGPDGEPPASVWGETGGEAGDDDFLRVFLLKLDATGTYQWHIIFGSPGVHDATYSVAVTSAGTVFVTAYGDGSWNGPDDTPPLHDHSGGKDIAIVAVGESGAYLWHAFYGSSDDDFGSSACAGADGNLYVVGHSSEPWNGPSGEAPLHAHCGDSDILVLAVGGGGNYLWHTFYGSDATPIGDYGYGIAVGSADEIYVTGGSATTWNGPSGEAPLHAQSGGTFGDAVVVKLNSFGDYQWHTFFGSIEDESDMMIAYDAAVDEAGDLYVAGNSETSWTGPSGQPPLHAHSLGEDVPLEDAFFLKLAPDGSYQWHTFYGGTDGDVAFSLSTGPSGTLYAIGQSRAGWVGAAEEDPLDSFAGGSGNVDTFVLSLDSEGGYAWHSFFGSMKFDPGWGISTSLEGDVYVVGSSGELWNGPSGETPLHDFGSPSEAYILALDGSGGYDWHTFYGADE
ncbi:MAG: hypothetical protein M0R80_05265 [Proteobacteria bacterium]|nr:hypothetical protein [Pseudomonadota bacterium]